MTRVAASNPAGYAGIALLSAVIEQDVIDTEAFRAGWAGRPALILHGARDDRIPARDVLAAADDLRAMGVDVSVAIIATLTALNLQRVSRGPVAQTGTSPRSPRRVPAGGLIVSFPGL